MSPTRASPKNASGKVSPTNSRKVASPKASTKFQGGIFNSTIGRSGELSTENKAHYNSSASGKKNTPDGVAKSHNFNRGVATTKSWDSSSKVKLATSTTGTTQAQKGKLR